MDINQFEYNGKRSYDDFCLIITQTPPFVIPERDISFDSISGRNGDLLTDNRRYKNITKEYLVAALTDTYPLELIVKKLAVWLNGAANYNLLTDTYDPQYFRYACPVGNISVADKLLLLGEAAIQFNCKPLKYSFEGRQEITFSAAGTIRNPEDVESLPYIRIEGSGNITLSINSEAFAITGVDEYIEIDSDLMSAHKGTSLQNHKISFASFPRLAPGWNDISFTGNVTKIVIVPRWCAL